MRWKLKQERAKVTFSSKFSSSGSIAPGTYKSKTAITIHVSFLYPVWVSSVYSEQHQLHWSKWTFMKTMVPTLFFLPSVTVKEVAHDSRSCYSVCQLKCVGKTACKDPVSAGHSGAGFRVSGMLTAFWTASTPLRQAKSYYPTWDSPVALLKPSNMLSFKCVCACMCVCVWRQAEKGRESSSRFTVSVSSCVCQCWPQGFWMLSSLCDYTSYAPLLPFSALLILFFLKSPQKPRAVLTVTRCLDEHNLVPLSCLNTNKNLTRLHITPWAEFFYNAGLTRIGNTYAGQNWCWDLWFLKRDHGLTWENIYTVLHKECQWHTNHAGWLFSQSTCHSSHCRCSGLVWFERITGWRSSVKYSFLFVSGSLFLCVYVCVLWVRESERDSITVNACQNVCTGVCVCVRHIRQCLFYFFSFFVCVCVCVMESNGVPTPSVTPHIILSLSENPSLSPTWITSQLPVFRDCPYSNFSLSSCLFESTSSTIESFWGIHNNVLYISWGSDVALTPEMYYYLSICWFFIANAHLRTVGQLWCGWLVMLMA